MRTRWITTITLLLAANTSFAQTPEYRLYGELGIETVDEDTFLAVRPGFDWALPLPKVGCDSGPCETEFRLSLHLPLRFFVDDDPPDDPHAIRNLDWDQPSDFTRVLKRLQYGESHEPLFLRVGELGFATIGNGTLVSNYVNNVQVNSHRAGIRAAVNTEFGGIELLIDQVFNPGLVAGRGFVYPFGREPTVEWWKLLQLGFTFASDTRAPVTLSPDSDRIVDGYDSPVPLETAAQTAVGFDVSYEWSGKVVELVPYADLNLSDGVGFHAGVRTSLRQPSYSLWLQLEAQTFTSGYLPQYFGTLYDIERFQFVGWGTDDARPKSQQLANIEGGNGFRIKTGFNVGSAAGFEVDFSRHNVEQSSQFTARLSLRPTDAVSIGLFYHNTNSGAGVSGDDLEDLFSLDGAVLVTEARVELWSPFYVVGRFDQKYALGEDGRYETNADLLIGVGAQTIW